MTEEATEAMTLALSEVYHRFLYKLPPEEQESTRFMVHLEQGHWFYTDELMESYGLPDLKFPKFLQLIKNTYRILPEFTVNELKYQYGLYKKKIPVRGGILLNRALDKVLLVTNITKKNFVFPQGKTNEMETAEECAVREVLEEVGYDISTLLVAGDFIETDYGLTKLFIVSGVAEHFKFHTLTQGEIGSIEWVPLTDIQSVAGPQNSQYTSYRFNKILKFLPKLRKWIRKKRAESPAILDCASIEYLDHFKKEFCKRVSFHRDFKFDMEKIQWKIESVFRV